MMRWRTFGINNWVNFQIHNWNTFQWSGTMIIRPITREIVRSLIRGTPSDPDK